MRRHIAGLALVSLIIPGLSFAQKRPMTFLDMQQMRQGGSMAPSPDRKWLLYTTSIPNWQEAKRQSDISLVSLERGLPSTRQLTFTTEKSETSPRWAPDGSYFAFLSDRDGPMQLYTMRTDGGEARRVTSGKDTVSSFAFSKDGNWIGLRMGKSG